MLSYQGLSPAIKRVPINTLVIDEASQIEDGEYLAVFSNFFTTLRKLCFVGDDKQREYCRPLLQVHTT
jgi:hypothetical protein